MGHVCGCAFVQQRPQHANSLQMFLGLECCWVITILSNYISSNGDPTNSGIAASEMYAVYYHERKKTTTPQQVPTCDPARDPRVAKRSLHGTHPACNGMTPRPGGVADGGALLSGALRGEKLLRAPQRIPHEMNGSSFFCGYLGVGKENYKDIHHFWGIE